jgi:hypothetical protein
MGMLFLIYGFFMYAHFFRKASRAPTRAREYLFSFTCISYQKEKCAKPENLPKNNAVWVIGEHWM